MQNCCSLVLESVNKRSYKRDYNIVSVLVNSERRLAKSRVDITQCQPGKFLFLYLFVLYYKTIKHFPRIDIQLYHEC
jgi:hypothetical protein